MAAVAAAARGAAQGGDAHAGPTCIPAEAAREVQARVGLIAPVLSAQVMGQRASGAQRAKRNLGSHAYFGDGAEVLLKACQHATAAQRGGRRGGKHQGEATPASETPSTTEDSVQQVGDELMTESETVAELEKQLVEKQLSEQQLVAKEKQLVEQVAELEKQLGEKQLSEQRLLEQGAELMEKQTKVVTAKQARVDAIAKAEELEHTQFIEMVEQLAQNGPEPPQFLVVAMNRHKLMDAEVQGLILRLCDKKAASRRGERAGIARQLAKVLRAQVEGEG